MKRFISILLLTLFVFVFLAVPAYSAVWKEFPLNVYIEYNPKKPVVKKAFWAWQSLTKIPKFNYVDNEKDADIVVKFDRVTINNGNGTHTAGYTRWSESGGYMNYAEITLMSVRPNTNMLISDKDAYIVALHEVGHALGLPHTNNPQDVMFYLYSGQPLITTNDLNALRRLYGK